MERLEACYFCGTAEDAPLRDVTVTPRHRRDDPDAAVTLTLCASCEGKLERVLGGLFDHVESRPAGSSADEQEPDPVDRIDVSSSSDDGAPRGRRDLFDDPPDPAALADVAPGGNAAADEPEDAEIIDDEDVTARATVNSGGSLDGVSVGEYNRVLRLLQNREFPMARAAFVDLAASAYDFGEDTVEQVLDAAIDRGALAERRGELVRPDGEESG